MTTRATPAEFEALMDQLDPLRAQMETRHPPMTKEEITSQLVGIARLHFEVVGLCPICSEVVRRCDSRRPTDDERLAHIACLPDPKLEDPASPLEEIAYEPGCDCARYLPLTDIYGNERCARCDRTREQPS